MAWKVVKPHPIDIAAGAVLLARAGRFREAVEAIKQAALLINRTVRKRRTA